MNAVRMFPEGQRGSILNGWLPGIALLVLLMFGVARVLPVYVDHNYLVSTTRSVLESTDASGLSQTEMRRQIAASLRLNNVRSVDPRSVVLIRSEPTPAARIQYEKQVPVIYNIELLITFDETVER